MEKTNFKQIGIGLLLIFLCYFIVPNAVGFLYGLFFSLEEAFHAIVASFFSYILMIAILIFYYRDSLKKELNIFLLHKKELLKCSLLTWLKALFFMMITNSILIWFAGEIAGNESANRSIISMYPFFSIITMIGLGPFMEELLFRKGFKGAFKSEDMFCYFTAFLFGFAHVSGMLDISSFDAFIHSIPQLLFIIPYGGIGYFFARAYCDTDTVFTSTVTHMIHNTFAVLVSMFGA